MAVTSKQRIVHQEQPRLTELQSPAQQGQATAPQVRHPAPIPLPLDHPTPLSPPLPVPDPATRAPARRLGRALPPTQPPSQRGADEPLRTRRRGVARRPGVGRVSLGAAAGVCCHICRVSRARVCVEPGRGVGCHMGMAGGLARCEGEARAALVVGELDAAAVGFWAASACLCF